jgi:hypothetical protein
VEVFGTELCTFNIALSRLIDGSIPGRVRELLPFFDAQGFSKLPAPASKTFKPQR